MLKLIESIQNLQQTSQSNRKSSDTFLQALKEWAITEDLYSRNMARISIHPGLLEDCFSFIRSYTSSKAQRSKALSENISANIIEYFKQLLNSQSIQMKNTMMDSQKIIDYVHKKCGLVSDAMNKYFSTCRNCELVAFDLDKEQSTPKKEKHFQKMMNIKKETDTYLAAYQMAIEKFNGSREKISRSIQKVLDSYSTFEQDRLKSLEESLEVIESLIQKDGQEIQNSLKFDKKFFTKSSFLQEDFTVETLEIETYDGSHPLFQSTGASGLHFSVLETSGVSKGTQIAVEELYKNEIGEIVTKAWNGQDLSSEDYVKFNTRLREPVGRKVWSWCMNSRRTQGIFKICENGFGKVGELMLGALNECERTSDIQIAKNCIILSQTFYKEDKDRKVFLQHCIMDHTLWKNNEFWENVIDNAIEDELKKSPAEDGEESRTHEKQLVFCQLVSFGNIMMSFKLSNSAEMIIQWYAGKYNLTEIEVKDIMNTIHESL